MERPPYTSMVYVCQYLGRCFEGLSNIYRQEKRDISQKPAKDGKVSAFIHHRTTHNFGLNF